MLAMRGGGVGAPVVEVVVLWWRVEASVYGDRVDRPTRSLFGLAGNIPPEKFSGGGGGCRLPA
ncbi:hypothetical protein Tco_1198439, partial [Tanacetum coccineum]